MNHRPDNLKPTSDLIPAEDDRRDYDPADYKHLDDKRFLWAKKEAIFAQILCLISIIVEFFVAYALCPEDVSQMTYILGFPTWFIGGTCVALLSYLIMLIYCLKFSRDFSLDARDQEEEEQQ